MPLRGGGTVTDARDTCAQKLEQLANDQRFSGRRDDLESLAVALRDQGNGSWTGVDLVSAFPTDATITVRHRQFLERLFGVLAGASVFFPVAWTWFSLRSATTAYDEFLAAHTQRETAGQTFLALWTTGFEGRLPWYHQFAPMAFVSLLLILGAMALIVAHRLIAEVNVSKEDTEVHQARKVLVVALVQAQRLLNERRTDDPRFLEEAIKRSVGELRKAQTATRKGVEELGAAATRAVQELGAATTKSVEDLNSVSSGLLRQMEPLLQATTHAGTSLSEAAQATVEVQRSHADLGRQTGSALQSLTGSVEQVASAKDEWALVLGGGLAANERAIDSVNERIGEFLGLLQDHEGTLQAQANELGRAADLSSQVLNELRERAEANGTGH